MKTYVHPNRMLALVVCAVMLAMVLVTGATRPATADTGVIALYNQNSGKCLDVPYGSYYYGAYVQQYTCNGGSNQQWVLTDNYDGSKTIQAAPPNDGWVIAVANDGDQNNNLLVLVNYYPLSSHWWRDPYPAAPSAMRLRNRLSNRCMDVANWSLEDHVIMQIYDCFTNPDGSFQANQTWIGY
jgi:hypothetical protein